MRMIDKGSTIVTKNASLRARINIGQPTKIINTRRCYLMSSDTNSLAGIQNGIVSIMLLCTKYRKTSDIWKNKKRYRDYISQLCERGRTR